MVGRVCGRAGLAAAGCALHVVLLSLPVALIGALSRALTDPSVVLFLGLAAALGGVEAWLTSSPRTATEDLSGGGDQVLRLAMVTGCLLLLLHWVSLADRVLWGAQGTPFGAALMLAGLGLRAWSIHTLGGRFVTELTAAPREGLVQHGPYRYLHHPSELGLVLFGSGAWTLLGSRLGALVWLFAILPAVAWRVRVEERFLRASYGGR